jgi:hypothetical protein
MLNQPAVTIGDLVASRQATDREGLHEALLAALSVANEATDPVEPLSPTVGDEFQGAFRTLSDVLLATILVRACMPTENDVRFGVGVGSVERLGRADAGRGFPQQDGPGWWAARDAVDFVASAETRRGVPRTMRTWIGVATAKGSQPALPLDVGLDQDEEVRALNAFLVTRDHLVSAMDDRDRRILRGLLLGTAAMEIAEEEGVTASAISQRSQRSGALALAFAHKGLA